MKQTILITFLLLVAITVRPQSTEYSNPVIPEDMADPCVIRIDDTYYATGTSSEWAPHYPIYQSKDLVNWQQTGHVFDTQPRWTLSSFWAPELFYYNNKVYCYYTTRNKNGVSYIGVASSDSLLTRFTDHGLVVEYGTESIDAFILEDNGQLYISWKAYGLDKRPTELLACRLSADGLRMEGEPFSLMADTKGIGMEGQHWMKYGDYYYIIYSIGGCCGPRSDYQVYVARSKNLEGPYEDYTRNPILHGDGKSVLSCGHGTVTTTPDGRMYYLYHAYLTKGGFYGGRQPMLQELYVGDDEWIHFKDGRFAKLTQPMPFEGTAQNPTADFRDDFSSGELSLKWAWNYPYSSIRTKFEYNELLLSGFPKKDNDYGTALCVRPTSPNYSYETRVSNNNASLKGLTMYGDLKNLLIFGSQNNRLILKTVKDGKEDILLDEALSAVSPYLKIEVKDGAKCDFLWSKDGKIWNKTSLPNAMDVSHLVRWDRVARPGIIHVGATNEPGKFSYFNMVND